MTPTIKLLLVDDHLIFLEGLASILSTEPGLQVLGTARSGWETLHLLKELRPDVILLDINMNAEKDKAGHRKTGVDLIAPIREQAPGVAIVMLTMHDEDEFIRPALRQGVEGYVLKDASREELVVAIHKASQREFHYSRSVADAVIRNLRQSNDPDPSVLSLTRREVEMIRHIAAGLSTPEIAEKLFIAENTVKTHRKNLYSKTGVRNVAELIRFARENHLLDQAVG